MRRSILAIVLCAAAWTAATAPAQAHAARDSVTIALDWTPNTNHTGIYVAQKLGYYKAAGIDVQILPYASTAPETLVSHGKADFGFSYSAGVAFARAAGEDVTSVFAVLQHTALEIGVRADRTDIATPKDLDGKTYAGFGTPDEKPLLETVILLYYAALAAGPEFFTDPRVLYASLTVFSLFLTVRSLEARRLG